MIKEKNTSVEGGSTSANSSAASALHSVEFIVFGVMLPLLLVPL